MGHHRVNSFFLLRYHLSNTIQWRIHAGFVDGRGGGGLWFRLWYIGWDGLTQSVN